MILKRVTTNLSQSLSEIEVEKATRDDYVKCILADKQILARIVKHTISDMQNLSVDEIMNCIGEATVVLQSPENIGIKLGNTGVEDIDEENGKIIYDIRFPLYYKEKTSRILVNIEAQKSIRFSKLKYHIENRMTYYMSRMISSQKNSEFTNSDYDGIKPIYSIWICMDTNKSEDSIISIGMESKVVFGKSSWIPDFGLMNGAIIRIREGENVEQSRNELIAMLELLLSRKSKEEKKERLEKEYELVMTTELEGRVDDMCNLSDVFEEQAVERGIQQGLISMIIKKVQKKKDLLTIADEVEQSVESVRPIYEAVLESAPDYELNKIYDRLEKMSK